jgi:hypothetical protein
VILVAVVRRRTVLAGLGSVVGLAGCSDLNDAADQPQAAEGGTDRDGERDTTTSTATDASLAYRAAVESQPTDAQPPAITVGVRNKGDSEVRLATTGRGNPFEDLSRFTGRAVEFVAVSTATGRVDAFGLADRPVDGCWRFVGSDGEPARVGAVSTAFAVSLAPGSQYTVTHRLYQAGTDRACLPAGTYESATTVYTGGQQGEATAEVTYLLAVEGGRLSALSVTATAP